MTFKKLTLLVATYTAFVGSTYAGDNLGPTDQFSVNNTFSKIVSPTIDSFFSHKKFSKHPKPTFYLQVQFNESKFKNDFSAYQSKLEKAQKEHMEVEKNRLKQMYQEITGRKPKDKDLQQNRKITPDRDGPRFGRLNIDLDPVIADEIIAEGSLESESAGPAVSFQMPDFASKLSIDPFNYDPVIYVNGLTINLSIPDNTSDSEIASLSTTIKQSLLFTGITIDETNDIKVTKIEPFSGEGASNTPSLSEWFMSPSNATIGIVLASLILGLFAVICIFLLSKVFSRIAGSIAELKPEPVADSIGENNAVDMSGGSQEEIIVNADVEDVTPSRGGSEHDSAAALSAMTSEMRTIRDQLAEIIHESPQVCSELLRDLCYEDHGMEDFRDLLSFAGYTTLKNAMEKLPESVVLQLQAYIEDNRDSQVNLIRGCEVAQRIYRDTVSKISVKSEASDKLSALKEMLVMVDDAPLAKVTDEANAKEVSILLRLLSVERGNRLMKSLDSQKLKEACDLLDAKLEDEGELCEGLKSKLETAQDSVEHSSQLQTRFILRLAKSATIEEESSLLELIPKSDWNLKFSILKNRFLFSFSKYIPGQDLRRIFDSYDLAKRCEMLFCVGDEIKQIVLAEYPEGSKMSEMIADELKNVENNKTRNESVRKNKVKLLMEFLEKVRAKMSTDTELLEKTLMAEFKETGAEVPQEITSKYTTEEKAA